MTLEVRGSRLSQKLRTAIDLRVRKGKTIAEACREAGLSISGWHKAMARAEVRLHVNDIMTRFVAEAGVRRAALRLEAMEVAANLLQNAQSETTKVRLIELLLSDGKSAGVSVHVDARQVGAQDAGVYSYSRPASLAAQVRPPEPEEGDA